MVDYKEESDDEVDGSPAKKRKSPKKKGKNPLFLLCSSSHTLLSSSQVKPHRIRFDLLLIGVKEMKTASPKKKVATPKNTAARPKKALVEMGTQTTPGLKRGRGRPKKKAEPVDSE